MISTVLIVDDYPAWRRSTRLLLRKNQQYHVVAEAADGLEAIERAFELRPDIVLMDLCLPEMNGIEAAERILARNPACSVLFVSEQRSPELIDAAIAIGAAGYVIKSHAGRELLPAMDAIVDRRRLDRLVSENQPVPDRDRRKRRITRHEVGFYSDEDSMLEDYTHVAATVLSAGHTFVILAGTSRREKLRRRLDIAGVDVVRAIAVGKYHNVAAQEVLASFMVNGALDEQRFWSAATDFVKRVTKETDGYRSRVVVCGECAPRLLAAGNVDAALRLEHLWDELTRSHSIDTLCGYLTTSLNCAENSPAFEHLRREHSAVAHPAEPGGNEAIHSSPR